MFSLSRLNYKIFYNFRKKMSNLYVGVISSNTTITFDQDTYLVNAAGGNIQVTLPDMSECGDGPNFMISRIDSGTNNVTIRPYGTELINGLSSGNLSSNQLSAHQNVRLVFQGGNWYTIHGEWIQ